MMGIGMVVMYLGYAIIYWGVNAIEGNSQASFVKYVLPFAK